MARGTAHPSGKGLFSRMEGCTVICSEQGKFYQCELYSRGGLVFAKKGSWFFYLIADGVTSVPSIRWDELIGFVPHYDKWARIFI